MVTRPAHSSAATMSAQVDGMSAEAPKSCNAETGVGSGTEARIDSANHTFAMAILGVLRASLEQRIWVPMMEAAVAVS